MFRRALSSLLVPGVLGVLLAAVPVRAQAPSLSSMLPPQAIAARAAAATVGIRARAAGRALGSATGFFVGPGVLATNYHAIRGADRLEVALPDGSVVSEVALLATDPHRDLALLRVAAPATSPLPLGRDEEATVGDRVYVMGSPRGMDGTFSDGMLSAKRRVGDRRLLQISAPISPGSSGGPVMNEAGEVIGVVALSVTRGQNLNLAVAAADLRALLAVGKSASPVASGSSFPTATLSVSTVAPVPVSARVPRFNCSSAQR